MLNINPDDNWAIYAKNIGGKIRYIYYCSRIHLLLYFILFQNISSFMQSVDILLTSGYFIVSILKLF